MHRDSCLLIMTECGQQVQASRRPWCRQHKATSTGAFLKLLMVLISLTSLVGDATSAGPSPAPEPAAAAALPQIPTLPFFASTAPVQDPAAPVPVPAPTLAPAPTPETGAPQPPTPAVAPAIAPPASPPPSNGPKQSFIRVANVSFVDGNCREFFFSGWNSWVDAVYKAIFAVASLPSTPLGTPPELVLATVLSNPTDPISQRFQDASTAGFTAMRLFGFGGDDYSALESSPGVYNETIFQAIDYIIALAGFHNIKIIYTLTTYWQNADAIGNYVLWAGQGTNKDAFWTDPTCLQLYKDHVKAVVTRVNTFTGVVYRDDPTILAYDVFNEMRCPESQSPPGCPVAVKNWIDKAAAYLKSLDSNHLVTVGEEGFSEAGSPYEKYNPFGTPSNVAPGWALNVGQDIYSDHSGPNIDFVAYHMWPDNFNTLDLSFLTLFTTGASRVAAALGKPLLLEEFGKEAYGNVANITAVRTSYYNITYGLVENSLQMGGPLKGVLFWQWNFPTDVRNNDGVYSTDPTFGVVTRYAAIANSLDTGTVAGCTPLGPAAQSPSTSPPSVESAAG